MSRGLSVIAFAWNDIPQCNSLARISRRIKSFSYNDGRMNVPNIDMYISEIGIVAGEKTWQKLAKEKTIANLLDKMILEIV